MKYVNDLEIEIEEILNNKRDDETSPKVDLSATLHTEELDITPIETTSTEIISDYINNISDNTVVSMQVLLGTMVYDIFPFKDNLEVTLYLNIRGYELERRFRARLLNNNKDYNTPKYTSKLRDELDNEGIVNLEIQCTSPIVEVLNSIYVSGIYKNTTVQNIIYGLFSKHFKSFDPGGEIINPLFRFVIPDNDKEYNHIIIPHGTKLIDLPHYLQYNDYGVYNGDIGLYLNQVDDDHIIHLFPLYTTLHKNYADITINILETRNEISMLSGRMHTFDGEILNIIVPSSTEKDYKDESDLDNISNGYIMVDPYAVLNAPIDVDDIDWSMEEIINLKGDVSKVKKNLSNNFTRILPTTNEFKIRSNYIRNNMYKVTFDWENSEPELLQPGSVVNYKYVDGYNDVNIVRGVVANIYTLLDKHNNVVRSKVTLLVEKE